MCVTALIAAGIATAGALGQAVSSISSASANKKAADYEALQQERQLYRTRELQRLNALQTENAHAEEFNQARSSAMAAIGASGLGEHISFFQGADPEAKRQFLRDVGTVRLNMLASRASIADQVGVVEHRKAINSFNANMSKIGAVAEFVQTAMQAVAMYGNYSTPKPAAGH